MKGTILLLESDSELRKVLAIYLENLQWRVLQSKTKEFAMQLLEKENPDILISELDPSGGEENDDLIAQFHAMPQTGSESILVITTFERLGQEAMQQYEPDIVIHKPFDVRSVGRKISRLLEKRKQ